MRSVLACASSITFNNNNKMSGAWTTTTKERHTTYLLWWIICWNENNNNKKKRICTRVVLTARSIDTNKQQIECLLHTHTHTPGMAIINHSRLLTHFQSLGTNFTMSKDQNVCKYYIYRNGMMCTRANISTIELWPSCRRFHRWFCFFNCFVFRLLFYLWIPFGHGRYQLFVGLHKYIYVDVVCLFVCVCGSSVRDALPICDTL